MVAACFRFFFFHAPATTEIYTLSLHDALPIWPPVLAGTGAGGPGIFPRPSLMRPFRRRPPMRRHAAVLALASLTPHGDRKSTRLNSSHPSISYAVFCLKKKMKRSHTLL